MLAMEGQQISLNNFIYDKLLPNSLTIALYIVLGAIILKLLNSLVNRALSRKLNLQTQMLIRKAIRGVGIFVISVLVLNTLDVPLSALLGTAGIVTVAVGIASQNSMGNLISGIFLLSEQSFVVGDVIEVGAYIGTVQSVDLLSVKIRTFDGLHLRIPNETLIKSEITTITKNPLRRVPLSIGISYYDNIEKARDILFRVAREEKLALKDPEPFFMVSGYGESSINLFFGVWGKTPDFALLKTNLLISIKRAFDAEGIEIPFPHLTIRPPIKIEPQVTPKQAEDEG